MLHPSTLVSKTENWGLGRVLKKKTAFPKSQEEASPQDPTRGHDDNCDDGDDDDHANDDDDDDIDNDGDGDVMMMVMAMVMMVVMVMKTR